MAHKKQAGKGMQHVNPSGKRLGLKVSSGQKVNAGEVLARQTGTKLTPGLNVTRARDFTLYAEKSGVTKIGSFRGKKRISILA